MRQASDRSAYKLPKQALNKTYYYKWDWSSKLSYKFNTDGIQSFTFKVPPYKCIIRILNCRHKFKIEDYQSLAAYSPVREIVYRTRLTFLAVVTGSTKGLFYFAVESYARVLTAFCRKWQRIWKSEFMRSFPKLYRWEHMFGNAVALDSQFKTKNTGGGVLG